MKKELSNEINVLLEDHADALTAFYDEGIKYGENKGMLKGIVCATIIATTFKVMDVLLHKK